MPQRKPAVFELLSSMKKIILVLFSATLMILISTVMIKIPHVFNLPIDKYEHRHKYHRHQSRI